MKKKKADIWLAQLSTLLTALRFKTLEPATQNSLLCEMLYFNNSRIVVIAVVILIFETMNIIHVLCFSKSGLATNNNRQYFSMYLILLISALLSLIVRHVLRNKPALLQRCYVGFTLIWVLWHAVLSSLDLKHNPNIVVFVTGILGISLLIRIKPVQMFYILTSGLVLLFCCSRVHLSTGNTLNAVIVTIITMLIFCSRYFSTLEELRYRQKMILQENHRRTEKQKLALLSAQQTALLHHSRDFLFLWDKEQDTLYLSGGISLSDTDRETLLAWLAGAKDRNEGTLSLQLNANDTPHEYQIERTLQLDCDDLVIGAAGLITEKTHSSITRGISHEIRDTQQTG